MIWRVRGHATFRALARASRHRNGLLAVRAMRVGDAARPPAVAYAVGHDLGDAVARNRARRRLRAAVHARRDELRRGWAYLVSAGRPAMTAPFPALTRAFVASVRAAHAEGP